ncbi:MAG: hypothetical protein QG585_426 [Patescibacteria group bacterium]|nr:hypothetical protein [Patescibacteria group bacterium]
MELHNLPNDKKKKIALGVATSFTALLLVVWGYKFSITIPDKITETQKDVEELSVVGKGVANVYLSVKSEVSKIGAVIKSKSDEVKAAKSGTTTFNTNDPTITIEDTSTTTITTTTEKQN